jgi:hypothetical protein
MRVGSSLNPPPDARSLHTPLGQELPPVTSYHSISITEMYFLVTHALVHFICDTPNGLCPLLRSPTETHSLVSCRHVYPLFLLCGCKSGDVHTIRFSASSVCSRYHQHRTSVLTNKTQKDVRMWTDETPDQIQCLAHHKRKNSLAVGCGNDVLLVDYETSEEGKSSWTRKTTLPSPPRLPGSNGFLPNPIARSISFLKGNRLLVSYLDHGIV